MDERLTERQERILVLVIREYIATARPVSSGQLVRHYELGVSAATVRNELAVLEERELLVQPHTSAGRVPTVPGYRYFIEHLMTVMRLPTAQLRTIRHQFHQAGWDPERWMRLSAAVIAQTLGAAGLVATPRDRSAGIVRVELIDLGNGLVQLVAIARDGQVRQGRWRPSRSYDQSALDRIARYVNNQIVATGQLPDVAREEAPPLERMGLAVLRELTGRPAGPQAPRVYHAGLTQILSAPEFASDDRLRAVVELLEHGLGLDEIIARLPGSGVQVFLGGEPPLADVPEVSLVLARFGQSASPAGVLGVVGPTRLPYERAVPTVGYIAELMNGLLGGRHSELIQSDR